MKQKPIPAKPGRPSKDDRDRKINCGFTISQDVVSAARENAANQRISVSQYVENAMIAANKGEYVADGIITDRANLERMARAVAEVIAVNLHTGPLKIPPHLHTETDTLGIAREPETDHGPMVIRVPQRKPRNIIELPMFGTVAAGVPGGPLDVADGTMPVHRDLIGKHKPADLYVVRVNGRSMEPEYRDGRHILCRRLRAGEFAAKGQDVIACDAAGAYLKRLIYTKDGPKGDRPRKAIPHLASLNPDFPEVVPLADCPIVAVVVSKL